MLAGVFLAFATLPFVSSAVEKPALGTSFSTALETNGKSEARTAPTALDAERAFAADARQLGQWTAFRKWAASDATMFVPQPTNAQAWLKDRKDPAKAIDWWPTASYVSCDGGLAVNTGGWKRPDGSVGYFSTVWQRQPDGGWKWIVDRGDALAVARPMVESINRAAGCAIDPIPLRHVGYRYGGGQDGASKDGSVQYHWWSDGNHTSLQVEMWNGFAFRDVIVDPSSTPK